MTQTTDIQLLGDFVVRQNGQPVAALDSTRLQALLTYLLLHRGVPQLRHHIAFTFWPDSDEAQARTNLRNLLHRLRQVWPTVDEYLHIETKSLTWRTDVPLRLDVADFEQYVTDAHTAVSPATTYTTLQQAIALYQGDLLPGCYDDWILSERTRLGQLFRQALTTAVELAAAQEDYPTAVQISRQLLETDPLSETSYRQLMHLYAKSGDRAAALRVYYQCVATLRRELDIGPSTATQTAYQRLMTPTPPLAPHDSPAKSEANAPTKEPTLIGRQTEWQQLTNLWRQTAAEPPEATTPAPTLALLSGEAGIGKTRLADELLAWVRRQGATTAVTSCYAAEAELAFAPLAGWLKALPLDRLPPLWRTELARLRPQLLLDDPSLSPPGSLTEAWQQRRFFTALTQALQTARQPLLLLLDDLQWCDEETLAWLHTLLHRPPPLRLLLLATYRREEIPNPSLDALLATGRQLKRLTTLSLTRLSPADTAVLAAELLPHLPASPTADAFFRHTEGNPLFIVETARAMQGGDWDLNQTSPLPLPDNVQAMLESRLAQLSATAREVASLAAVMGRSFTFDVVGQASDLGENELLTALDELWQRRIVMPREEQGYDFSHEKLREVVYEGLSPARRRWLHGRVLDALHPPRDETIGALAYHAARAGRHSEAARYALQTGQLALNRFAYREAVTHFSQALEHLDQLDPAQTTAQYDALNGRAQAWYALSDQAALEADLAHLQTLADVQNNPHWQAEVAWRRAELAWLQGDQSTAQALAEAGLTWAREAGDGAREAAFLETLARVARNKGDYHQARRWVEAAHERFTAVGHHFGTASTLDKLANLTLEAGDAPQAAIMHAEAAAIFRELQATPYEARALSGRALALKMMGDYETARQTHRELLATAETFDDRHNQWVQQILLGNIAYELGDYATAVSWFGRALTLAQQLNNPRDLSMNLNNLGEAHREMGAITEARRYYEEGLALNRAKGFERGEANSLHGLGLVYLNQNQPAAARDVLQATCALWRTLGERLKLAESLASLALAALAEGQLREAQTHIAAALTMLGEEQNYPTHRRWVYFAAYQVWDAVGDDGADEQARLYLNQAAQAVAEIGAKLPPTAVGQFQQARLNQQIAAAKRFGNAG